METVGILVVAYGARETAIIDALSQSPNYKVRIYVADKQENPFNLQKATEHVVIPDLSIDEICKFGVETLAVSNGSMDSFTMLDLELANKTVDRSKHVEDTEKNLNELIVSSVQDRKLAVALKGIVWNLAQIARASQMVSEVAMNRYLENNTDICQFWKERKGGGDVQYLKKVVA